MLYVAARRGRADLLRRALDACKGAGVNLANRAGKTPLHAAAVCGDAECVEMLFYRDASVDARDDNERTPLWAACRRGNAEAVACLCRLGADPNAQDASLVPPLVCAAAHGSFEPPNIAHRYNPAFCTTPPSQTVPSPLSHTNDEESGAPSREPR